MQRKLRHASWVLVANASLVAMACATAIVPQVGDPNAGGPGVTGGGGGATGGSGGAVASAGAGPNTDGGKAGASEGGAASGGAGQAGGTDGNAGSGGKGPTGGGGNVGNGGGGNGGGGKGGNGGSGAGGGNGGSGAGGGTGGTGGANSGGGGTSGGGKGGNGGAGKGGAGGGVNLITNSGFETSTSGWSVFGGTAGIATTPAQSHSGTQSLVITGRTQTYQGPQYSVLDVVTPGTSYSLSVWGRLTASNATGSLTVTLHYACTGGSSAGDNYMTWVGTSAASASSWTQFSGVHAFPACAGGTMTAASFYVESPTATLSYYIDDVVLTTP